MGEQPDHTVDLAEFAALRSEINNRTTLAYGLIALQVAALGAGASLVGKFPTALLALAGVSSFLWLFWVDHAGQVYKIAAYIGVVLSPRLTDGGTRHLGWERFVRDIEAPARRAGALSSASATGTSGYIQRAASADWYTAVLFGLAAPALVAGCLVELHRPGRTTTAADWAEVSVALALWIIAVIRFGAFKLTVDTIAGAITAVAATPAATAVATPPVGGAPEPDGVEPAPPVTGVPGPVRVEPAGPPAGRGRAPTAPGARLEP